jgi:hypothetical protein
LTELPTPRAHTRELIALADEVANRPLPLHSRKLIPAILAIVGVFALWLGLRDTDAKPGPTSPTTTAVPAPSVVFTAPP